jgi:predicted transcriptional regulator
MANSKTESEIALSAELVAAYVSHNSVPSGDLVDRIRRFEPSVYALTRWNCGKAAGLNRLILSTSERRE